jgi:urease accessory protein
MQVFTQVHSQAKDNAAQARVILTFEQRQKTRGRIRLAQGSIAGSGEIGIDLPRGTVLRNGDYLCEGACIVAVEAAVEQLLEVSVSTTDPALMALELARIAYHLGNRHVAVQLLPGALRLELDHVLESMVLGLGAKARVVNAAFDPETGAYGGHAAHSHGASYADTDLDPERFKNNRHAPKIHDFLQAPLEPKA